MQDQKLENLLNLALSTTVEEREKSVELNVGFNPAERTWELIVKYVGDISNLSEMGIQVTELMNQYAILVVPETLIDMISRRPEIVYVEKPKRLFFAINQAKAASCINQLQVGQQPLTGKGVIVAVIDSGYGVKLVSG